jgi:hypothetical protein
MLSLNDTQTASAIKAAPFDGTTACTATGPVVITINVTVTDAVYKYVSTVDMTGLAGTPVYTFAGKNPGQTFNSSNITSGGAFVANNLNVAAKGVVTLNIVEGAEFDGGPYTANVAVGDTGFTIPNVKLKNIASSGVIFKVEFAATPTFTYTADGTLANPISGGDDTFAVATTNNTGGAGKACAGDTLNVAVTGTEVGSGWDTGTLKLKVVDASGVEVPVTGSAHQFADPSANTATFTFTMPASNVTYSLVEAAP